MMTNISFGDLEPQNIVKVPDTSKIWIMRM